MREYFHAGIVLWNFHDKGVSLGSWNPTIPPLKFYEKSDLHKKILINFFINIRIAVRENIHAFAPTR